MPNEPTMRAYEPSLGEKLRYWIAGDQRPGQIRDKFGQLAQFVAENAPVSGQALAADRFNRARAEGSYRGMGMAALGMMPGGSKAGKLFTRGHQFGEDAAHAVGDLRLPGEGLVTPSGIAETEHFGGKMSARGEAPVQRSGMAENEAMAAQPLRQEHNYPLATVPPPPAVQTARDIVSNPAGLAEREIHPVGSPAARDTLPPPRLIGGESAGPSGSNWYGNFRHDTEYRLPETMGGPSNRALNIARTMAGMGALGGGPEVIPNAPPPAVALPIHSVGSDGGVGGPDGSGSLAGPAAVPTGPVRSAPSVHAAPVRVAPQAAPVRVAPAVARTPDYQSNSRDVMNSPSSINWGSDDSAADFVRADRARQALLRQGVNPTGTNDYARGGFPQMKSAIDPVYHAMMILRHHMGD